MAARMRSCVVIPAVLLLIGCLKAIHSEALPQGHVHHYHDGHVHTLKSEMEPGDDGERKSRMLATRAPRPAYAPSEGLVPEPAAAPAPPTSVLSLAKGFNAPDKNDSRCGAPLRKPGLSLALDIFFELLQDGLPDDMRFKGNVTYLSSWRGILKDLTKIGPLWPEIKSLAQDYFNLTLPLDVSKVASKLPKYDTSSSRRRLMQTNPAPNFTVPVYFLVVTDPNAYYDNGESVTLDSIQQQLQALNNGFLGTGFSFTLGGRPKVVKSPTFFSAADGSDADLYYKTQYRQGGPESLNVYVRKPTAAGLGEDMTLLGIARFPESLCANGVLDPTRVKDDGISILYNTLPDQDVYSGATLVHEAGHWLGLMHTFNQPSSCNAGTAGDGISQTPIEMGPYNQNPNYIEGTCDPQFNSCPDQPGFDPISNWMDYSPDKCYDSFTSEQIAHMQANYLHLRQQKQCSYPGQESPFLESQNDSGKATRSSAHPLSALLFSCIAFVAFMCLA